MSFDLNDIEIPIVGEFYKYTAEYLNRYDVKLLVVLTKKIKSHFEYKVLDIIDDKSGAAKLWLNQKIYSKNYIVGVFCKKPLTDLYKVKFIRLNKNDYIKYLL